ncbi:hypothetical protein RRF57_007774 [Xylaria bambusicola]|uniref:Uncharacterized protein n=1 Tax=Xylaria bambusicola TaxID=326684 RepID=A0AAN7Z035_9PEZI
MVLLTEGERETLAYDNITESSGVEDSEWNGFEDLPLSIIAPSSITAQVGSQADDRYETESLGVTSEEQQHTINMPNTGKRNRSAIASSQSDSSESSGQVRHYTSRQKRLKSSSEETAIQGYFITAYRNLTTAMIEDLKADSARWNQERRRIRPAEGHQEEVDPPYNILGVNLRSGNDPRAGMSSSYASMSSYTGGASYPIVQYAAGKRYLPPNLPLCSSSDPAIPAARNPAPENRQRQRLLPPSASLLDRLHSLSISEVVKREEVVDDDGQQKRKNEAVRKLLSVKTMTDPSVPASRMRWVASQQMTEFTNARDFSRNTAAEGSLVGWTVVTVAWLERDFEDCEKLWQLMRMKAHVYLRRSTYWNVDEEEETWAMGRFWEY